MFPSGGEMLSWLYFIFVVKILISPSDGHCGPDDFDCTDGQCISKYWRCDPNGVKHCRNGKDEDSNMCHNYHNGTVCSDVEYRCTGSSRCIPSSYVCDGHNDCGNNEDEESCRCPPDRFACAVTNQCIDASFLCDGDRDCTDGSDEAHCDCSLMNLFRCNENKCIPFKWVCDGKIHCDRKADDKDEGDLCDHNCTTTCVNGVCQHFPEGPRCVCDNGFTTNPSGVCEDIDECLEDEECDHECENSVGGYQCSCASGYQLSGVRSCKVPGGDGAILIAAADYEVIVYYINEDRSEVVYTGPNMVVAVAYDPSSTKVYWSDKTAVYRKLLNVDGEKEIFLNKDIGNIHNLAMDWVARNLYLADEDQQQLIVCNVDKDICKTLLTGVSPRAILLDLVHRNMYWTDVKNHAIFTAEMDGSRKVQLIQTNVTDPNGIALDSPANKLYWINSGRKVIESYDLETRTRKEFIKIEEHAYGIAVWEDKLYWTTWHHKLWSIQKNKKNQTTLLSTTNQFNGITIFHRQMFAESKRANQLSYPCTHLSLLTNTALGYTCACPDEMELVTDLNCISKEATSIIINVKSKMKRLRLRKYFGPEESDLWIQKQAFGYISDLDYNPVTNEVFVCDEQNQVIEKIDLEYNTVTTIIQNLVKPKGIAVDWTRGNLYWVDNMRHSVEVATLDGMYRKKLDIDISCHGLDIEIHRRRRRLLIACDNPGAKIIKCSRDGEYCAILVNTDIRSPIALSVDQPSIDDLMYWYDSSLGRLESIDLDGRNRKIIIRVVGVAQIEVSGGVLLMTFLGNYYSLAKLSISDPIIQVMQFGKASRNVGKRHMAFTDIGWSIPAESTRDMKFCDRQGTPSCAQLCLEGAYGQRSCGCASGYILDFDGVTCTAKECNQNEYKCKSGECIPLNLKCNLAADCSDSSDEETAVCTPVCPEFTCTTSGQCLSNSSVCDGVPNCADNSDENCTNCSPGYSQCASGVGCYLNVHRCNSHRNCLDGSDELNCPKCSDTEFTCRDRKCIPYNLKCNFDEDCLDGSDEENCPKTCRADQFPCSDGSCISIHTLCDSKLDCPSGEDEAPEKCHKVKHCSTNDENCKEDCHVDQFTCRSMNQCIGKSQKCDGKSDCRDASDEVDCVIPNEQNNSTLSSCEAWEFDCGQGDCIDGSLKCNGEPDCPNTADDYAECGNTCRNNGGCQHNCRPGPKERSCYCRVGFTIQSDGISCKDMDECAGVNECEQYCTNAIGGFICSCKPGYNLEPNGYTCKQTSGLDAGLVILDGTRLQWIFRSGMTPKRLEIPAVINYSGIIYDSIGDNYILVDKVNGNIAMLRVDTVDKVVAWSPWMSGFHNLTAVALDVPGQNLYLAQQQHQGTESFIASIKVCSLHSLVCSIVHELNGEVSSLAVASKMRMLFFCVQLHESTPYPTKISKLFRSDLDGSEMVSILPDQTRCDCEEIALDEPKTMIYWTDRSMKRVMSATWKGQRLTTFKQLERVPVGLFVAGSLVQWRQPGGLRRCHKYYTYQCKSLQLPGTDEAILASMSGVVDKRSLACPEGACPNVCVSRMGDSRRSCLCNDTSSPACFSAIVYRPMLTCDNWPCFNGGDCSPQESGYTCMCPAEFTGERCTEPVSEAEAARGARNKNVVLVFVILLVLVLVAGVFVYYYFYHKRVPLPVFTRKSRKVPAMSFSNRAFGASKVEVVNRRESQANMLSEVSSTTNMVDV